MKRDSKMRSKLKRQFAYQESKKQRTHEKLKKRMERAEQEKKDPAMKKKRLAENIPRTLDNTREFDPTTITANPAAPAGTTTSSEASSSNMQSNTQPDAEAMFDISTDPFASYFSSSASADTPPTPKVLITTSQRATRASYEFCEEIVDVFPGAQFVRRKKGHAFEIGRIAGWAAKRGYENLIVVNEDRKKPNAITMVHLPSGPTAYFKLTSIELTKDIHGHARATPHAPELVLNNFVTRLGHTVGRMFQTLFPPLPEFQGRQVVTLHNQRDFLFFRRHRYAFRSPEKAVLQEIGPRFTLKLRWLKKGIPSVGSVFESGGKPLSLEIEPRGEEGDMAGTDETQPRDSGTAEAPEQAELSSAKKDRALKGGLDEYEWRWKPELETTRRTFFL